MHYLSNCFLVTLFLLSIAFYNIAACQEPPKEMWRPKKSLAIIDFDNKGGGITIAAKIDGVDRKLFLDTGFSRTLLDVSLLRVYAPFKIDEEVVVTPHSSEKRLFQSSEQSWSEVKHEVRKYQCPSISIGGIELKTNEGVDGASIIDTPLVKADDTGHVGILGMDQLCAFGLHIDYDNRKVVLFENVETSGTPPGTAHKLVYNANCPTVLVSVAEKDFYVTIDTGNLSDELAMKESTYKKLLNAASIQDCDIQRVNRVIFESPNQSVVLKHKLEWGEGAYQPINIYPNARWNMLGARFLMRHRLTFDFVNNVVYVADGAYRHTAYHNDFDGIVLSSDPDDHSGLKVLSIAPGSIAENAGIQPGDYLLSIGKTEVTFESLTELCRVVCVDRNNDLEVKLRRDNTILTVTLPRDGNSRSAVKANQ
ncbi:MAG: PDZ domain-containing protein [Planctomycetaceae bacterium]